MNLKFFIRAEPSEKPDLGREQDQNSTIFFFLNLCVPRSEYEEAGDMDPDPLSYRILYQLYRLSDPFSMKKK